MDETPEPVAPASDDSDLLDRLLSPRGSTESGFPEAEKEVKSVGKIRFRALSREEAHQVQKAKGAAETEIVILKAAMLKPRVNRGNVMKWQQVAPAGELQEIVDDITALSGMNNPAMAKEIYKSLREEQGI